MSASKRGVLLGTLLIMGSAAAQPVRLVDPTPGDPRNGSDPSVFTAFGSATLFACRDGLCKTNGTTAGTGSLPLYSSIGPSTPGVGPFLTVGAISYFPTGFMGPNPSVSDLTPWRTDGTSSGTYVLVDDPTFNELAGRFALAGSRPVFGMADSVNGRELWTTDGTTAGTVLLADIEAGAASSDPAEPVTVGTLVVFAATTSASGRELFVTDGTATGTALLKDINPGVGSSTPRSFVVVGNRAFFTADDGVNGEELWVTDGTANGTYLVQDIAPGAASSTPRVGVSGGTRLFFVATTTTAGAELWTSDGTSSGTVLVRDVAAGATSSSPQALTFDSATAEVYFSADDGVSGRELWKTTSAGAGAAMVSDLVAGAQSSTPNQMAMFNGKLYFQAYSPLTGVELWRTDGTGAGTQLVVDLIPGPSSSSPRAMSAVNGLLYFNASDPLSGAEPWVTDGTAAGTSRLADLGPNLFDAQSPASGGLQGAVLGSKSIFVVASDSQVGSELFAIDVADGGFGPVIDLAPGPLNGDIGKLTWHQGLLYFTGTVEGRPGLYVSDGTAANTRRADGVMTALSNAPIQSLYSALGSLFIVTSTTAGPQLWKSDGTQNGTALLKTFCPGGGMTGCVLGEPTNFFVLGGTLFFRANDGTGAGMWKTNGSVSGTSFVSPVQPEATPVAVANGVAYGAGSMGGSGIELMWTNGTAAGTALVDLNAGSSSSDPYGFDSTGDHVYFISSASVGGTLYRWLYEATPADGGVRRLREPSGTSYVHPVELVASDAGVFFVADDNGTELFAVDVATGQTRLLKDSQDGGAGASSLARAGRGVLFSGSTRDAGAEPWFSDGTNLGTVLIADLSPGSSFPGPFVVHDARAFFFAAPGLDRELYLYDLDPSPPLVSVTITGTAGNNGWYVSPVSVSFSVTDPQSGFNTSGCSASTVSGPTSGTLVPCSAASAGGHADAGVLVRIDPTPPQIQCPADVDVTATSSAGATVTFTVAATDALDPAPVISSTPASGTVFAIGNTAVTATASDEAGNSASCTFAVRVAAASTVDAGTDAGTVDAGAPDSGIADAGAPDAGADAGTPGEDAGTTPVADAGAVIEPEGGPAASGCGCGAAANGAQLLTVLIGVALLRRRRAALP